LTKTWKKEQVEKGSLLLRALSHPFRVQALHVMNQREASPKEVAYKVGCQISTMSYHVRQLEKVGFVELVREEKRRGAIEHFYRGTGRAIFHADEWVLIPEPIRAAIVGMELTVTGELLSASLGTETFERRADRHHSLHQEVVDEKGWKEAMKVLEIAMEGILKVKQRSAERRLKSGEAGIPLAVSLLGFERAAAAVVPEN